MMNLVRMLVISSLLYWLCQPAQAQSFGSQNQYQKSRFLQHLGRAVGGVAAAGASGGIPIPYSMSCPCSGATSMIAGSRRVTVQGASYDRMQEQIQNHQEIKTTIVPVDNGAVLIEPWGFGVFKMTTPTSVLFVRSTLQGWQPVPADVAMALKQDYLSQSVQINTLYPNELDRIYELQHKAAEHP